MSLLSQLEVADGSTHKKKRLGRGDGSGHGGTSGKGHKGQLARSGGRSRRGFEGGQTPLYRRLPKFGFKSLNRTSYAILNLSDLNQFEGEISPEALVKAGVISKTKKLKVLGNGVVEKAVTVKAHKFSETAKAAIEKAGGKAEVLQK
jgi:large subunit ribosomal protein L15